MIKRERVILADFIYTIVERIQPVLKGNNIIIDVNCTEDVVALIDPERFKQVFINILDNAQKHVHEGKTIMINVKQTANDIIITITDEGEGIPEEDLPFIFDRLYRGGKAKPFVESEVYF